MKILTRFPSRLGALFLFTGVLSTFLPAAEEALIDLIPAEAIAVAHVRDASQLAERLETSALGKIWQDAKIQRLLAPALESFSGEALQEESVQAALKAVRETVKTFEGETVVSLIKLPFEAIMEEAGFDDEVDSEDPEVKARRARAMEENLRVLAAGEVAGDGKAFLERCRSAAETIIEGLSDAEGQDGDKGELIMETIDGEELHILRLTNPKVEKPFDGLTYALVNGVGIIGVPRQSVEEAIAARKKGLAGDRISSGAFGQYEARFSGQDVHLHVNLEPLLEAGLKAAEDLEKAGIMEQAAASGFTVRGFYEALGLGDLKSLDLSVVLDGEATVISSALQFRQRSGLMKVVAYTNDSLPETPFIPSGVSSASVSLISLQNLWQAVIEIMEKTIPVAAPAVKQQLIDFETQLGVSLEKDLLGNLKPEIIGVEASSLEEQEVPEDDIVIMFGLKNEQGFEVAFDKVLAMASGMTGFVFEPSEFLGQKLHTIEMPSGVPEVSPVRVSYLFSKGYFMLSVGKGETLRKVLSNMERPGNSLWDEKQVQTALQRFPAGYSEIAYSNLAAMISGTGRSMVEALGMDEDFLDWENMPTLAEWRALVGVMVSATYVEKNGFFGQAILLPSDE